MFRLWLITALPITIVSLFYTHAASAFEATFELPCMISYNGQPPISTRCITSVSISQGVTVEKVKTPNGRMFIIKNNQSDIDEWYLNSERAVKTSDEPNTCYKNQQVEVCL